MGSDKNAFRDSSGRRLVDYPRPSVAVDAAVLTVTTIDDAPILAVLQVRAEGRPGWSLPGTFLHPGERLTDAVLRCLDVKAGVTGVAPRQLAVFDDPDRDPRGWVLSVAHVDVVPVDRLADRDRARTRLRPVRRPGRMPYDQTAIVAQAFADTQTRYRSAPDPAGLVRAPFTLRELRLVHEAIAGKALQRDTFCRLVEPHLKPVGSPASAGVGRPAQTFVLADRPTDSPRPGRSTNSRKRRTPLSE